MPLVAFRPTKARLIIERGAGERARDARAGLARDETVSLAVGGRLESASGFLRIRERNDERGRSENKAVGSIVYVPAGGFGGERSPASFADRRSRLLGRHTGPNALDVGVSGRRWRQVSTSTSTASSTEPRHRARDAGDATTARIVNIASVAGKEGNPNASAYSASKAGVIGLTKSLGKELAKTRIRVNCVTPAAVRTAIFEQMTPQHIDFMLSKIPMGRFGTVDEIAALVVLARERGVLVLDRRGVRHLGRARDVLSGASRAPRALPHLRA